MRIQCYTSHAARESTPESRLVIGCCTFPRLPLTEESEMIEIPLTRGQVALIDDADFELVSQHKWCAFWSPRGRCFYAVTSTQKEYKRTTIYMHRLIMGASISEKVDHINRRTLDNRRSELRLASHAQNMHNRGKTIKNTSGYKGVSWDRINNKWVAEIWENKKKTHLGRFLTKEEAYAAYCEAALRLHGEFARLA